MSNSETVREVCAEIQIQKYQTAFTDRDVVAWRDRILSAHEHEMAAKDAEIARLKEALKHVMACDIVLWDDVSNAVREARRIMKEGEAK